MYYNSTFQTDPVVAKHYWAELNNISDVKINDLLSSSYRRAAVSFISVCLFNFAFIVGGL